MKLMQIFLMVFITTILILMIPLSFILYSINQTVLKPYSWDNYITKSEIMEQLPERLQKQFSSFSHPLKDEYEELFITTLEDALDGVVTQEWMDAKADELQTNIWDYLLEVTDTIQPIHMDEIKEAIIFELELVLDELGMPEENMSQLIDEIEEKLPAQLYISDVLPIKEAQTAKVKKAYQESQQGYDALVLLTIILFVLGLILAFYPKILMRWSGYVLGVIGLLVFLVLSLINTRNNESSTQTVEVTTNPLEASFTMMEWGQGVSALFVSVLTDIVEIIYPFAIGILVVGLLLVLLSHLPFVHRIDRKIRSFFANKPAWNWARAVLTLFIFAEVVRQAYQLVVHANALW